MLKSRLATLARYWHTLRYLKPVQFYGRLVFRYWRPTPDMAPAPPLSPPGHGWAPTPLRQPSMYGPGCFELLGVRGELDEIGWDGSQREKLWRYNQHYFDDLNADGAAARSAWHSGLIERWIVDNPPGAGTGWEPYPTSLRIVNWVKWHFGGHALSPAAQHSLAVQARWLGGRLEWHLLGNHLFCNAKALVFAGLAFEGPPAEQWLARGLAIIDTQLDEQILADGGNFERSPMYHAIFLEDLLDLLNASATRSGRIDASRTQHWRATAARMQAFLIGMTHPDGGISLFNDAALNIAPSTAALCRYAAALDVPAAPARSAVPAQAVETMWPDSGYVRLDAAGSQPATVLIDVAPVGPDYLPGHAHADTLSFELSLGLQRIVVNGGTSCYGSGPQRLRERGTAAHSTVEIDDADSSEVWGGFRVARRARPFDFSTARQGPAVVVACSHDGYRRLPGRPVHRRQWTLTDDRLVVRDQVNGGAHTARARFLLHPDVAVTRLREGAWALSTAAGVHAELSVEIGIASLIAAEYSPQFGAVTATNCILVDLAGGIAEVTIAWRSHTTEEANLNP